MRRCRFTPPAWRVAPVRLTPRHLVDQRAEQHVADAPAGIGCDWLRDGSVLDSQQVCLASIALHRCIRQPQSVDLGTSRPRASGLRPPPPRPRPNRLVLANFQFSDECRVDHPLTPSSAARERSQRQRLQCAEPSLQSSGVQNRSRNKARDHGPSVMPSHGVERKGQDRLLRVKGRPLPAVERRLRVECSKQEGSRRTKEQVCCEHGLRFAAQCAPTPRYG
jgi:hypothetical protein